MIVTKGMSYFIVAWESSSPEDTGTILGAFDTKEDATWSEEAMSGWCDRQEIVHAVSRNDALRVARHRSGQNICVVNRSMLKLLTGAKVAEKKGG
jgi:hypothetical protein